MDTPDFSKILQIMSQEDANFVHAMAHHVSIIAMAQEILMDPNSPEKGVDPLNILVVSKESAREWIVGAMDVLRHPEKSRAFPTVSYH